MQGHFHLPSVTCIIRKLVNPALIHSLTRMRLDSILLQILAIMISLLLSTVEFPSPILARARSIPRSLWALQCILSAARQSSWRRQKRTNFTILVPYKKKTIDGLCRRQCRAIHHYHLIHNTPSKPLLTTFLSIPLTPMCSYCISTKALAE